ncbi:MAG: RNA polymerase sigma factor [Monoglobales bacterium]
MKSLNNPFEEHKQHSFDCFCKRLLKNEMRNYYNEMKRRKKHEVSFSELTAKELERLSACDTYFADGQHIFNVLGNDILVRDETVAEALNSLPENKRDIILLSYFLDMTDGEIGEQLNLVRSTVQYRRTSILRELKKFMEEKGNE